MRRMTRVALLVIAGTALLAVAAMAVFMFSAWGRNWLGDAAAEQARRWINGDVSIGHIDGELFGSPRLHDVVIARDGKPILTAERIDVEYSPLQLRQGAAAIESVTVIRPVIHLEKGETGLTVTDLFRTSTQQPPGRPAPLSIEPITIVDGGVVIDPEIDTLEEVVVPAALESLNGTFGIERTASGVAIDLDRLSFVTVDPALAVQQLQGRITIGREDITFDGVEIKTAASNLMFDGSLQGILSRGSD